MALITVNAQGQNTIVVAPDTNYELQPTDLNQAMALLEHAALLVVQLEVPLPTVVYVVAWGRQRGKRVVLNPAPALPLPCTATCFCCPQRNRSRGPDRHCRA